MKNLCTVLLITVTVLTQAQQVLVQQKIQNGYTVENQLENALKMIDMQNSITEVQDSITEVQDSLKNDRTEDATLKKTLEAHLESYTEKLDSLKNIKVEPDMFLPSRITFYGLASLNGVELGESINSTGRLSTVMYADKARRFSMAMSANLLMADITTSVAADSVDFNSLMFPESGKFGFIFTPAYMHRFNNIEKENAQHQLGGYGEFAFRNVSIDSPSIGFSVMNWNFGARWTFIYRPDTSNVFSISLNPYFNLFNIPNEDVNDFTQFVNDELFTESNTNGNIKSIGGKATFQWNTLLVFADFRYNLNTKNFNDDNPFKGSVFNIGIAPAFTLKSW